MNALTEGGDLHAKPQHFPAWGAFFISGLRKSRRLAWKLTDGGKGCSFPRSLCCAPRPWQPWPVKHAAATGNSRLLPSQVHSVCHQPLHFPELPKQALFWFPGRGLQLEKEDNVLSYALVAINHTAGQGACLPFLAEMECFIFNISAKCQWDRRLFFRYENPV